MTPKEIADGIKEKIKDFCPFNEIALSGPLCEEIKETKKKRTKKRKSKRGGESNGKAPKCSTGS